MCCIFPISVCGGACIWFNHNRCLIYLAAHSMDVLQLVDAHLSITVSYQDTVCLQGEEQVPHVHSGGSRLHNRWLQAEDHREVSPTQSDRSRQI